MRTLLSIVVSTPLLALSASAQDNCNVCHGEHAVLERDAAHAAAGIRCIDCHGGTAGPLEQEAAHAGLRPLPDGLRAGVDACAECHADAQRMLSFGVRTDQLLLYRTSAHGQRLFEHGDTDVATCATCHGAHGVVPASHPASPVHPTRQAQTCGACHGNADLMARHELPATAPAQFLASVHGHATVELGSPASPTCSTCHGAHGAAPPKVESLGRVCGECHTHALAQFEASAHAAAARDGRMEECVSCHGSHAIDHASAAMLLGNAPGHCGECHADEPEVLRLGETLYASLSECDEGLVRVRDGLTEAAERGLFVENAASLLGEAGAMRRRAAPVVHALAPQALTDVLERGRGVLDEAQRGLEHEQRSLRDRRIFVGAFLLVDLLLVAVLLMHASGIADRATGTHEKGRSRG